MSFEISVCFLHLYLKKLTKDYLIQTLLTKPKLTEERADYRIATDYRISMATSQTALYCAHSALYRGQTPSYYKQYSPPM